ncbi:cAMP-dependent protein kinase inhibitor beta isoform X1 [Zalophus californianus]|nr:cAMP-dependent protein kinase inhibitor beta isoform X1 [Zalophus californianus]
MWDHGILKGTQTRELQGKLGTVKLLRPHRGQKDRDVVMRTDPSEMTDVESVVNNFASSARTGRRNAVPDIQGSAGTGGPSELPLKLEALSIKEDVKKKNEETTQRQLEKPKKEEK